MSSGNGNGNGGSSSFKHIKVEPAKKPDDSEHQAVILRFEEFHAQAKQKQYRAAVIVCMRNDGSLIAATVNTIGKEMQFMTTLELVKDDIKTTLRITR